MNTYLKFDVRLDESSNTVVVKLTRTKSKNTGRLHAYDLVGIGTVKIRFWDTEYNVCRKISREMQRLLVRYDHNRDFNGRIRRSCLEFSRETYTINDGDLRDLIDKLK